MQVKSMNEAWSLAKRIFPTDYRLDETLSKNAGYEIFYSTVEGNPEWISNLGDALELNMKSGTIRINVVEDKPVTMTATVRSLSKSFEDYKIHNVFKVIYIKQEILVLFMDKTNETRTNTYSSTDVLVEVDV